jgi:uncharacterized protein (DUF2126 family)
MKAAAVAADQASELLARLRDALGRALAPHGFVSTGTTKWVDGHGIDDWIRDAGWKRDVVGLFYRGSSPIDVAARVHVVIPVDRDVVIDATTASFLAGHGEVYDLPRGLLRGVKESRLIETIVRDSVQALSWFDPYATPEKCLARLDQDDRNGPRKGSPAHGRVVDRLREWPR